MSSKRKVIRARQESSNHNGSIGGIGTGLVERLLQDGYSVVATSREASRNLTTSRSLVLVDGDIGKQQTAADAVEAAINHFGTIDVLVNNAGIFLKKPFTDFTTDAVLHLIQRGRVSGKILHGDGRAGLESVIPA